jgi:hypothetical protein
MDNIMSFRGRHGHDRMVVGFMTKQKWMTGVVRVRVMVFNATFNNISVISWRSVLLVGKPEYPENSFIDGGNWSSRRKKTKFTPVFSGVRVTRSLVLCVCFVDRYLSFCTFSFGHCVVYSSSIYGF